MTVPIPNLDNRTFEQLLKEARRSIPHYAPEWTNHNPADPGITLIELFAWLAEIASYRINLVTEEHLLKYLKLLRVRPRGSQSAITDLSFETTDKVILKKGTVFLAEKDGENIDFELLEDITVIPFQLKRIIVNEIPVDLDKVSVLNTQKKVDSQGSSVNPSLKNKSTLSAEVLRISKGPFDTFTLGSFERSNENLKKDLFYAPFGIDLKEGSKLYLGFKPKNKRNKLTISHEPLNLKCYLYEKDLIEPGKHGYEHEQEYKLANARTKWEILVEVNENNEIEWKEVSLKDGTRNFTKSGSLLFTDLKGWVPSSIDFIKGTVLADDKGYFWLRCTLLNGSEYEYPPRIESILLNTATVIQKKRLTDQMLGKSNGLPKQIFKLSEAPVLRGNLKLGPAGEWNEIESFYNLEQESTHFTSENQNSEVRLGEGKGILKLVSMEEWEKVDTFEYSRPQSTHFTLEKLKGEIRFGDGLQGKIPSKGTEIWLLEWEKGREEHGIQPVNSIWEAKDKRLLGISSGLPGQAFKIQETLELGEDLKLVLVEEWSEVEDFDGSKPEDTHFTLESLTGEIRFGDGLRGKIPPKYTEVRVIEYETGKGALGNLPAYYTWVNICGLKIINLKSATGGKDEESIDQAFERFIRDLRVPYRAVTSRDFEYIAKETPGLRLAQAKAIPNFNPFSKTEEPGVVTVVVVPFSPLETFKIPPRPSKYFINAVAKHLEEHRLLGTLVYVVSPYYIKVEVQVTLGISKYFYEDDIRKDVLNKLNIFLHPMKGDFTGRGWPVGKCVYLSDIYQLLMKIEGIDFVKKIKINVKDGAKLDEDGNLILACTATIFSGEHSVKFDNSR